MAPPKQVCSIYAETYALYAQFLSTIADIRKALSKSLKIKNAILYGTLTIADAAGAQIIAMASAVATTIASQIVSRAAKVASTAIEIILAPILKILMSGPTATFALVNIPLEEAIKAAENEKLCLSKARANFDLVLRIFAKWVSEFGGGKYADKMSKALPIIINAIQKCETIINQLDVSSQDTLNRSSYFNEGIYNSMRSNIVQAIDITNSDPMFLNESLIEDRIKRNSAVMYSSKIGAINEKAKADKKAATIEYLNKKDDIKAVAYYAYQIKEIESRKKLDIEVAKLDATSRASVDANVYKGILNDVRDQFAYDMRMVLSALQSFMSNIEKAYIYYKYSQSATYSTYTIRNLINILILKMMDVLRIAGNGAGESVEMSIRFVQALLEKVRDLFVESLRKYSASNESISSTGLASKLAVGNAILMTADATLAASVTQSLIEAINSDEELDAEQSRMNILFARIGGISDWDGRTGVWGVNPSESLVSPYARLISSSAGVLATMVAIGLVPNSDAIETVRKKLSENARVFRSLLRHNAEVMSALRSYTPQSNVHVIELRRAIPQSLIYMFTVGPAAFDVLAMVVGIAGDALNVGDADPDDVPTVTNCMISYPELFKQSYFSAQLAAASMGRPSHFNNSFSAYLEEKELEREQARMDVKSTDMNFDDSELANPHA